MADSIFPRLYDAASELGLVSLKKEAGFVQNTTYFILNRVATAGFGFLFWFVAARLAPADEVGYATALVGAGLFMSNMAQVGMDVTLLHHLPGLSGPRKMSSLWGAFSIAGVLSAVLTLGFLVGLPLFSPKLLLFRSEPWFWLVILSLTISAAWFALTDNFFIALRGARFATSKTTISGILRIGLLVVFIPIAGFLGIASALMASMVVGIAVGLPIGIKVMTEDSRMAVAPEVNWLVDRKGFSGANYLVGLLLSLPATIGPIIILERYSPEGAALFYILWMIGSLALIVPRAVGRTGLVELVESKSLNFGLKSKAMALSCLAAVGILLGGLVIAPRMGDTYGQIDFLSLLPFILAVFPGLHFFGRLAQLRSMEANLGLVAVASIVIAFFILPVGLAWVPIERVGWVWLIALTVGALAGAIMVRSLERETTDG